MARYPITDQDKKMARICENCPVCRHAREKQRGIAFNFIKAIEGRLCPFCQAYEKVHGRKAHWTLQS